jgi:TolB-like protein/DNA-binding winged helix-turn-helix (wHTH) protein/Tfp pilus assembly protein PilF
MGRAISDLHLVRFGPYTADLRSGELYKSGIRLKLRDQSFQVLAELLERPGEVVTREQLRQKLWLEETFVDFDHGLNAAVERLRRCLGDSAVKPEFIETVPRRGYRFIGTIDMAERTPVIEPVAMQPTAIAANPSRLSLPLWIGFGAVLLLIALALGWRRPARVQPAAHKTMLVVLPFENLSEDPNEDYFSDGLTEEIIAQLGSLNPTQLGVIARTTSMAYRHTPRSAQQIGAELGVDYILETSIRHEAETMRITLQLIRVQDQAYVWAKSYDRQIGGSLALQEEVARSVAEQIRVTLTPPAIRNRPLDPQANEAYLRGRYFENQFTVEGYRKALAYFQEAIDRDPNFAEAYSGLADSYHFLVVTDALSTADGETKAVDAARRAVALGDGLAESHNSLASCMIGTYNWAFSEREFQRALALNPSYSTAHRIYAALLTTLGRHREALDQINLAMRTDPLSLPNNGEVVRTLYYSRDYDAAIEAGRKGLQLDPAYYRIHFWMARAYAQKHMYPEAVRAADAVLHAMPESSVGLTESAYSLGVGGHPGQARKIFQELEERARREFVPVYNLAIIEIALGNKEGAILELQRAYDERDWALMVLDVEPRLDPLRGEPRFQEIVRKVGLQTH